LTLASAAGAVALAGLESTSGALWIVLRQVILSSLRSLVSGTPTPPSQFLLLKRFENTDQKMPKNFCGNGSKSGVKAGRVALDRRIAQETSFSCK
jgi:hypothetical protein